MTKRDVCEKCYDSFRWLFVGGDYWKKGKNGMMVSGRKNVTWKEDTKIANICEFHCPYSLERLMADDVL